MQNLLYAFGFRCLILG